MSQVDDLRKRIVETASETQVSIRFSHEFDKQVKKIRDNSKKVQLFKQILKIVKNPKIGKRLRYTRKGEREVYLNSFRLYFKYYSKEKIIRIVEFSHKDKQ